MQPAHLSGRYYRVTFVGDLHTLLITFEPGDEQLIVMLLRNGDSDLKAIDDPAKTPRLSNLVARYLPAVTAQERAENETFFSQVKPRDSAEKSLLESAKDLRLVLPLHIATQSPRTTVPP